jgi:hypothetical protein
MELGVREDDHVVADLQHGVAADGNQHAVAHQHADPDVAGEVGEIRDGRAVRGRFGRDAPAVYAVRFSAEPYSEGPRFQLDGAGRQMRR